MDDDKIKPLSIVSNNIKEERLDVDEDLIELIEGLLKDAKEGKVRSLAGVVIDPDGDNIEFTSVEVEDELAMMGALHVLCCTYKDEHLTDYIYDD